MKKLKTKNSRAGFTLIEILLAIGILAILATAAIIAINPARQFADARNTQRWSDVDAIMNAVYQYAVSNKGALPPEIPVTDSPYDICLENAQTCSTIVGMPSLTAGAKYLTTFPVDPSCPAACPSYLTGYQISKNSQGRVIVAAPYAELGETIQLIR